MWLKNIFLLTPSATVQCWLQLQRFLLLLLKVTPLIHLQKLTDWLCIRTSYNNTLKNTQLSLEIRWFVLSLLTLKKLLVLTQDVLRLMSLYDLNVWSSSWDVGDEHVAWWQKHQLKTPSPLSVRKSYQGALEQNDVLYETNVFAWTV